MRILGHGIDLYELARVEKHLRGERSDWLEGVFSEEELNHADAPPRDIEYYGGRYAAKEAVAKALGTGFSDDVAWLDVEILRTPNGAPHVRLSGGALETVTAFGVTNWLVSISHSGGFAIASALALAD
jgi:holo-[acyl-carrier protein] synthase